MSKEKLNVVITGATSFIGIYVINEFLKNNHRVTAIVRPNSSNLDRLPKTNFLKVIELDMDRIEQFAEDNKKDNYDIFYHFAWDGARAPYRDDIVLQTKNCNCAIKAFRAAQRLNCEIFVGAGSQAEYGKCIGKINEEYPTNPTTEYGKAKIKSYFQLKDMSNKSHTKLIWTRIFSVYGIYDYKETLVMSALEKMKKNEKLLLTECTQTWDFVYVGEVARIMYLLGTTPCEKGLYNIASGKSKQLKDFVLDMKRICNSDSELQFGAVPYGKEGIVSFEPEIGKLKRNTGWEEQVDFENGIKKMLEFIC